MWCGVVSLFPDMVRAVAGAGVLGRAIDSGVVRLETFNPRDHASDRHRSVDDRPYGGGPGMVMMIEPLNGAIEAARAGAQRALGADVAGAPVIYLSPQGERLDQRRVRGLARLPGLILVAGRYEGVDERLLRHAVDEELSIGDYVLSGGELPALVVLDALARLQPGALGNAASVVEESHLDGLLDYPHYTRPEISAALSAVGAEAQVPAILLSGDHEAIRRWRRQQALLRTWRRRPDMLAGRDWTEEDRRLLAEALEQGREP
ncbi:MAG: tRNA (guanosine(37)-N1)-methyltransferase TrmD [Anaerolineae bacterium]|jgi:tRNA (guanine37-N1)-methyltransferase